jgi:hypothetical protein
VLLRVGLYASSPTLLQAKLPRTPYPDGRATVGGRKESMNIIASASKVVAVSVKGVQKNLNLVNTSSLVGSIIRSAKDGWAEGVAQVNSTQPRVKTPKTEKSKVDSLVDAAKARAARAAQDASKGWEVGLSK